MMQKRVAYFWFFMVINNIMASTMTKATIDSGADFLTITEEFAKHLGMKINGDNHEYQNTNSVVSSIAVVFISSTIISSTVYFVDNYFVDSSFSQNSC